MGANMTVFVGIENLIPAAANSVPTGSIAYHPQHKQWMLHGSVDGSPVMVVLTGDRAATIYRSESFGEETAAVIRDWRIEADLHTCEEGKFGAPIGYAFRDETSFGFYADWVDTRFSRQAIKFGRDGKGAACKYGETTVIIARWRIVTGDPQDPFVICSFEQQQD